MRLIATPLTILGILLHALLGWCPQHDHAACSSVANNSAAPANHSHCQGHCHTQPAPTSDQSDAPADSEHVPCCDHADCLFIDGSVASQKVAVAISTPLPFASGALHAQQAAQPAASVLHHLVEPPLLAQAARVARCVWLI